MRGENTWTIKGNPSLVPYYKHDDGFGSVLYADSFSLKDAKEECIILTISDKKKDSQISLTRAEVAELRDYFNECLDVMIEEPST